MVRLCKIAHFDNNVRVILLKPEQRNNRFSLAATTMILRCRLEQLCEISGKIFSRDDCEYLLAAQKAPRFIGYRTSVPGASPAAAQNVCHEVRHCSSVTSSFAFGCGAALMPVTKFLKPRSDLSAGRR